MLEKEFYKGREQAFVKHYVLENYLELLAFKIGMGVPGTTLNYVDGFSGPWQYADEHLRDTSPLIAIEKLRKTKRDLAEKNRRFNFRCLFIEKESEPFRNLQAAVRTVTEGEIETRQGEFENLVKDAADFASKGAHPFGFFFIDPTGWTGYPMSKLSPLFTNRRSELLINFMTSFIDRFVDDDRPETVAGFEDLFGDSRYRQEWKGLSGLDREDAIVQAYCRRLKQRGNYSFVGSSIVLDPHANQTYYHLVYATHHSEGMRVFREIEAKAYLQQEQLRAEVAEERRRKKTQIRGLFALGSKYDTALLDRYHLKAKAAVVKRLEETPKVLYDAVEETALSFPLTSDRDLKEWIKDWTKAGKLKIEGLRAKERVPKPGMRHLLIWFSPS